MARAEVNLPPSTFRGDMLRILFTSTAAIVFLMVSINLIEQSQKPDWVLKTFKPYNKEAIAAFQEQDFAIEGDHAMDDQALNYFLYQAASTPRDELLRKTKPYIRVEDLKHKALLTQYQRQVHLLDGWLVNLEAKPLDRTYWNKLGLEGCYVATVALKTNNFKQAELMGQFYLLDKPDPQVFRRGMRVQARVFFVTSYDQISQNLDDKEDRKLMSFVQGVGQSLEPFAYGLPPAEMVLPFEPNSELLFSIHEDLPARHYQNLYFLHWLASEPQNQLRSEVDSSLKYADLITHPPEALRTARGKVMSWTGRVARDMMRYPLHSLKDEETGQPLPNPLNVDYYWMADLEEWQGGERQLVRVYFLNPPTGIEVNQMVTVYGRFYRVYQDTLPGRPGPYGRSLGSVVNIPVLVARELTVIKDTIREDCQKIGLIVTSVMGALILSIIAVFYYHQRQDRKVDDKYRARFRKYREKSLEGYLKRQKWQDGFVRLDLGPDSYDIVIEKGLLDDVGKQIEKLLRPTNVAVITDETVRTLYGDRIAASLTAQNLSHAILTIPPGEESKSQEQANRLTDELLELGLDRKSVILAVGGGVVGDLAGYVAATFMRGVPFVQVPTTLLAQVDSSVGGKVAVNHKKGKNLIGFFYQPKLVLIDPTVLTTLSEAEYNSGMAEVLKYGILRDQKLFQMIEENVEKIHQRDPELLRTLISRSCQIKAAVVQEDEKEESIRAILNLGHTFGHAFELVTEYKRYRHGEAVAAGMAYAARLSRRLGILGREEVERILALLTKLKLPTEVSLNPQAVFDAMRLDKKTVGGRIKFILIRQIGQVIISDLVPPRTVLACLEEQSKPGATPETPEADKTGAPAVLETETTVPAEPEAGSPEKEFLEKFQARLREEEEDARKKREAKESGNTPEASV